MQIKSICIPQVYVGEYSGDLQREMVTGSKEVETLLSQRFNVMATHTMVVGNVGYLVYVMCKEA